MIALNAPDDMAEGRCDQRLATESDADTMKRPPRGLKSPDREVRLRAIFVLASLRIALDEGLPPRPRRVPQRPGHSDPRRGGQGGRPDPVSSSPPPSAMILDPSRAQVSGRRGPVPWGGYADPRPEFLPALEAAARDADPEVREAVAKAIEQVRGRGSPPDAENEGRSSSGPVGASRDMTISSRSAY